MSRGKSSTNKTKYRSTKNVMKEEKLQLFDRNLTQEMLKKTNVTNKEEGVEEMDKYLSVATATGNDIEKSIKLIEEAYNQHARELSDYQTRLITKARRNQLRGGRPD